MAVIVVGGAGRGVGKTSLVCGVIAALPERDWIGVKIASHPHGTGQPVWEESQPGEGTDTARYLAAGARRAFLLTAADDTAIQHALDELRKLVERRDNLIIESNRVLNSLEPDLCLMLRTDPDGAAAKASFDSAIGMADAVIVSGAADAYRDRLQPEFELAQLECISPVLECWVRGRLVYC